jgi:hypothetical protein
VYGNEVRILDCPRNGERVNGSGWTTAQRYAREGGTASLASPETGLEAFS